MSEQLPDEADPADVAAQQQDVLPEPDDRETVAGRGDVPSVPAEANEADVLEQHTETGDDEDDEEGDRG